MSSSATTEPSRARLTRRAKAWIAAGVLGAVAAVTVTSVLTGASPTTGPPKSALIGTRVASFRLAGLNGGVVRAPWGSGHPGVVIFFASWCTPCQHEMPALAAYVATHVGAPVQVVGVDALDAAASARRFVAKDGVGFAVASDPNGQVTSGEFGFQTLPETVFVNARGVVTDVKYGAISNARLSQGVATLGA
ncbi:MAG: TlpA family protein disulfide reductase [Acidimicrobiales bacterium]